tara:strand:+ start:2250 stop:2504 length:255 start_codon:yes stop_codon:yes gene_type:complete
MNSIWEAIIHLKRKNPRHNSRHPFITDKIQCLVVLNQKKEYVKMQTNDMIVAKHISKQCSKRFSIEDIERIEPITNYGESYAKE